MPYTPPAVSETLGRTFVVLAGEIGGACGNVIACDYCETILTPVEYQV